MNLVRSELANAVLTLTLDDADRRNVLSQQLLRELMAAMDEADRNPDVRVVMVTNEGSVFCAGADLSERSSHAGVSDHGPDVELSDVFQRVRNSPKPFVGRLNGHCVAGGVGLAAVMDISVAVDSARFGFTEVRVGVAPAMISVVCLPKMPLGAARSAFLRGNHFSAFEAAQMGLINQSVPTEQLDSAVTDIVNDLLAGEPRAIAAAKQLTNKVPSMPVEQAFAWTTELSAELFSGDEAREGMAAFLEKRSAQWVRRLPEQKTD